MAGQLACAFAVEPRDATMDYYGQCIMGKKATRIGPVARTGDSAVPCVARLQHVDVAWERCPWGWCVRGCAHTWTSMHVRDGSRVGDLFFRGTEFLDACLFCLAPSSFSKRLRSHAFFCKLRCDSSEVPVNLSSPPRTGRKGRARACWLACWAAARASAQLDRRPSAQRREWEHVVQVLPTTFLRVDCTRLEPSQPSSLPGCRLEARLGAIRTRSLQPEDTNDGGFVGLAPGKRVPRRLRPQDTPRSASRTAREPPGQYDRSIVNASSY